LSSFPISGGRENHRQPPRSPFLRSSLLRLMVRCAVEIWSTSADWRIKRPSLTRITAHLSIIAIAFAAILVISIETPGRNARASAAGSLLGADRVSPAASSSPGSHPEQAPLLTLRGSPHLSDFDAVSRWPNPYTVIPERPRAQVITYVVQRGDTLFSIAARFDLSPTTIIWSNRAAFGDVPWLVRAGTELCILPVDGVYHIVRSGETTTSIAARYDVDSTELYNEWNDLPWGKQPREGQQLVVPGGTDEQLTWSPPIMYATHELATYSHKGCGGAVVSGPSGHGWFTYPTGSSRISGWVFHDPRRRTHIGLDYRCRRGDPIYAADNGVVTLAGRYGTYGITIQINHGSGFVTRYGHLDSIAVQCGDSVFQGDLIGTCGNTGWSSGPHLHFEIRHNNVPQDPEIYLPPLDSD
jgi:murein DD-endopeptidase MepM/ murein hydrolase activator NlpD